MDCIFCKIANREAPVEIIYENEKVLGFESIKPETPIHLLFIPKRHLEWKDGFNVKDIELLSEILSVAKKVAIDKEIFEACKLIFNIGKTGHISHIHLHLLGGWKGEIPMQNI